VTNLLIDPHCNTTFPPPGLGVAWRQTWHAHQSLLRLLFVARWETVHQSWNHRMFHLRILIFYSSIMCSPSDWSINILLAMSGSFAPNGFASWTRRSPSHAIHADRGLPSPFYDIRGSKQWIGTTFHALCSVFCEVEPGLSLCCAHVRTGVL
jgi:hypothetical protein